MAARVKERFFRRRAKSLSGTLGFTHPTISSSFFLTVPCGTLVTDLRSDCGHPSKTKRALALFANMRLLHLLNGSCQEDSSKRQHLKSPRMEHARQATGSKISVVSK